MIHWLIATRRRRLRMQAEMPGTVARLWNGEPDSLRCITASKHPVFTFCTGGRTVVLKLTDQDEDQLEAQAAWVEHLAAAGVPVCRPVYSIRGRAAEPVWLPGSDSRVAFALEFAPGRRIDPRSVASQTHVVRAWGALAGRIHAASKRFDADEPREIIPDDVIAIVRRFLHGSPHVALADALEPSVVRILALPRDADSYGIVHGDLAPNNLRHDGSRVVPYDFESWGRSWFAVDVAAPLFAILTCGHRIRKARRAETARRFLRAFSAGYGREHRVSAQVLAAIPDFVALLATFSVAGGYRVGLQGTSMFEEAAALAAGIAAEGLDLGDACADAVAGTSREPTV